MFTRGEYIIQLKYNTLSFIYNTTFLIKKFLHLKMEDTDVFIENTFPMEFIQTEKTREEFSDSIILTTLEYLLSLNWPIAPKQPPMVDVGSCVENFIRNIINKNQTDKPDDKCKISNSLGNIAEAKSLDYNQLLQVLQTILNKQTK